MPDKFIKVLYDRIQFAAKKGLTGYVSHIQVMDEVHAESMNLWKKYVDEFERTTKINLYLHPFEKTESVTVDGGASDEGFKATTAGYRYPVSVATANHIEVPVLTIAEYNYRFKHPNKGPDADHPICKFVDKTIYVAPKTDVVITYLSKPVKPVYAASVVDDVYVYDDAGSTDLEWDEVLHDDIMKRVLATFGLVMRDGELIQFSQMSKAQEGK